MIQKAGRIGGEAQGACSLGAPLPQGVLAGGFVGTVGGAATGATVASQPAEHEEREPRAGCKRLPVVVSGSMGSLEQQETGRGPHFPVAGDTEVPRGAARGGGSIAQGWRPDRTVVSP